jgi:hypothetical protein
VRTASVVGAIILLVVAVIGLRALFLRERAPQIVAQNPPVIEPSPIPNQSPVSTPSNQIVAEIADGDKKIAVDQQGKLSGLESIAPSDQQLIARALSTGRIETSRELSQLSQKSGSLMGEREGVAFALTQPVGVIVLTDRPPFRWHALEGATSYQVSMFDSSFNKIIASPPLSVTSWTPPQLERGKIYSWQVTAMKDGKEIKSPIPPAAEAKFKVLDRARVEEIDRAKRSNSHLVLGVLYARDGLTNEAEREFRELVKENPDSSVARNLLRSVQARKL